MKENCNICISESNLKCLYDKIDYLETILREKKDPISIQFLFTGNDDIIIPFSDYKRLNPTLHFFNVTDDYKECIFSYKFQDRDIIIEKHPGVEPKLIKIIIN